MYILSWSGGKDSTASIILAHEHGEPLDIILFSEVMFDLKNNISGENPEHIYFIRNVAIPLFESWGYKVKILRAESDYLSNFYHIIKSPRKNTFHKGMYYGFPISGMCSIKRDCKIKPIDTYLKSINEPVTKYIGICADEPVRLHSMHKDSRNISLLEKYGYTEEMAWAKCLEYGLLSPAYKYSKRGGCWFCPNAKVDEHYDMFINQKDVWQQFCRLEKVPFIAHDKWNAYTKETLEERNKLFEKWGNER